MEFEWDEVYEWGHVTKLKNEKLIENQKYNEAIINILLYIYQVSVQDKNWTEDVFFFFLNDNNKKKKIS